MSNVIDSRVVEMRFDNQQFEKGVQQSIGTLDKLKQSLNFSNVNVADKINLSGIGTALSSVGEKFTAFEAIALGVFTTIGSQAVQLGEKLVKSLSIDQLSAGWAKYEQKTGSVQTIMAATASQFTDTGEQMEYVNDQLDKLNWFTDETSYNFVDMVGNIGKFTSNGIKLDSAVTSMQGIATWAAISGQNATTASRAMYNLAQAIGVGTVKLIDWRSIETANMATVEFKQNVLETAANLGTLVKTADGFETVGKRTKVTIENFSQALNEGWFTKDVLQQTLDLYGSATNKLYDLSQASGLTATDLLSLIDAQKKGTISESDWANALRDSDYPIQALKKGVQELAGKEYDLGIRSLQAAQEAKTFTEAIDSAKDAVSTGWMKSFELMFGDYEHAKVLWTDTANALWDIFASGSEARNLLLSDWASSGWEKLERSIKQTGVSVDTFERGVRVALTNSGLDVDGLIDQYGSLSEAIKAGAIDAGDLADAVKLSLDSIISGSGSLQSAEDKLKEIQDVVSNIWSGGLGNGDERKQAVEALGLDYDIIQKLVNKGRDYTVALSDLTEEELKAIGLGEEEIEILKNIQGDYDRLLNLSGQGGRELLGEGFLNVLYSVSDAITLVKDTWTEFFDTLNGDKLRNITKNFRDFTEGLRLYDDATGELTNTGKKVHHVLELVYGAAENVFKVFQNGGKIFGDFLKSLGPVAEAAGKFAESMVLLFTSVTGRVADFLGTVDLTEEFGKVSQFAAEAINFLTGKVDELRVKFEQWKPGEGLKWLGEKFGAVRKIIADFFTTTDEGVTPFQKILDMFDKLKEKLSSVQTFFAPVVKFFQDLWQNILAAFDLKGVDNIFEAMGKILTNGINLLFKGIKAIIKNVSLGDLFEGFLTLEGINIFKLGNRINWILESVWENLHGFANVFDQIRQKGLGSLFGGSGVFGEFFDIDISWWVKNVKILAESLLMVGAALLLVAAALAIMAAINPDNLARAFQLLTITIATVAAEIVGFAAVVKALEISPVTLIAVSAAVLIFAAALLVLAAALAAFALVAKMDTMWEGFIAMAASVTLVAAALGALAKNCNSVELVAAAASILVVAAALVVLGAALGAFALVAMMPSVWDGFLYMAASLTAVSLALGLLAKYTDPIGLVAAAAAILIVSAALVVMAAALATFTLIANQGVAAVAGLLTLVAVLAALTVALVVLSALGPQILIGAAALTAAAIAVVAISAGLAVAVVALTALGAAIELLIAGAGVAIGAAIGAIGAGIGVALAAIAVGVTAVIASIGAGIGLGLTAIGAGITSFIGSFGQGIGLLIQGIGEGIQGATEAIALGADALGEAIESLGESIGTAFEGVSRDIETGLTKISEGINKISESLSGVGSGITDIGTGIENFGNSVKTLSSIPLVSIGTGLVEVAKGLKELNKNKFTGDAANITSYAQALQNLSQVSTQITTLGATLKSTMLTLGNEMSTSLAQGIQNGVSGVTAAATTITNNLNVSLNGAVVQAQTAGTSLGNSFINGIRGAIAGAQSAGANLGQSAYNGASGYVTWFNTVGYNMSMGLASGIYSGAVTVYNAAASVASNAASAARRAAAVRSPSRVFAEIGKYMSLGMAKGIEDTSGAVEQSAEDMVNSAIDSVGNAMTRIVDAISSDIDASPVITPVLDLSNVETNSKRIGSLLSANEYSLKAAGDISIGHADLQQAALAKESQGVVATIDPNALAAIANANRTTQTPVVVKFEGSLAQLGAVLQPVIVNETDRLGPSLIHA